MDYINDLYEMSETLGRALKEANEKIRSSGGKLSTSDMDYVNKLSHALKSLITTAAMQEAEMEDGESYDGGGSYRGESYARGGRGGSGRGGSYARGGRGGRGGSYYSREGGSYDDSYEGGSYARGRGQNARRDSMGRYSREGYSRDGGYSREDGYSNHNEMVDELKELMANAPDERTRREMAKLIQKMEQQ